ncbi:hypothetical protein [Clostridium nigeriense]|uniref:hypothetical protein n=1 Tax=Clostridium nigeriense TaxID=1805470 RepID=UPI00083730D2|nr:hypothetical protein [Clostridium nigeriense]
MKSKYVKQFLVYFMEVTIISFFFVIGTNYITRIETYYEAIERFFTGVVFYQGLIFMFNKNTLDTEKDMILALKTYLELCKLYVEFKEKFILDTINDKVSEIENKEVFIKSKYLNIMKDLQEFIISDYLSSNEKKARIEMELINIEHIYEEESLKWKYTLLLKYLK